MHPRFLKSLMRFIAERKKMREESYEKARELSDFNSAYDKRGMENSAKKRRKSFRRLDSWKRER